MKTLVIIPAFNEEATIGSVIRSIKAAVPEADIVVVNDGSRDLTAMRAQETGLAHVVSLPVNLGIGGAMQTGYLYADRHDYDIAVQMDGDGQHDADDLRKLIDGIERQEADCLIGSRFLTKTPYRSSRYRRAGIWFFAGIIRLAAGIAISDPTSGFRAVNRKVIALFASYYPDDYPEVETIVLLCRLGYSVREKTVLMRRRAAGASSITPMKSLYYLIKVSLAVLMTAIRTGGQALK